MNIVYILGTNHSNIFGIFSFVYLYEYYHLLYFKPKIFHLHSHFWYFPSILLHQDGQEKCSWLYFGCWIKKSTITWSTISLNKHNLDTRHSSEYKTSHNSQKQLTEPKSSDECRTKKYFQYAENMFPLFFAFLKFTLFKFLNKSWWLQYSCLKTYTNHFLFIAIPTTYLFNYSDGPASIHSSVKLVNFLRYHYELQNLITMK